MGNFTVTYRIMVKLLNELTFWQKKQNKKKTDTAK